MSNFSLLNNTPVFGDVCRQVYRPAPEPRLPLWLRRMWAWL
jgi:hypothetical protein